MKENQGRDNIRRKKWDEILVLGIGALALLLVYLIPWERTPQFQLYDTDTLHYENAVVLDILREELEPDPWDSRRNVGEQEIVAQIRSGEQKGQEVTLVNYLTQTHNVPLRVGSRFVLCADMPEGIEPYYSVYNYDRKTSVAVLLLAFVGLLLAVGRGKGGKTILGLAYTGGWIICFMLPALYHGVPALASVGVTVLATTAFALFLLNGISRRSLVAVVATLCGVMLVMVLFSFCSAMFHLSGYNMDEAETLLVLASESGFSLRDLLMVCVMVSAMGAIMDVAVSLTAALDELNDWGEGRKSYELFAAGMRIGQDMIGTMSNTLILAFVGMSLPTLLCFLAFGYSPAQLISSDYISIELVRGICSTMGVILTVPITSVTYIWLSR